MTDPESSSEAPEPSSLEELIAGATWHGVIMTVTCSPEISENGDLRVRYTCNATVYGDALFSAMIAQFEDESSTLLEHLEPQFSINVESCDIEVAVRGVYASLDAGGYLGGEAH